MRNRLTKLREQSCNFPKLCRVINFGGRCFDYEIHTRCVYSDDGENDCKEGVPKQDEQGNIELDENGDEIINIGYGGY